MSVDLPPIQPPSRRSYLVLILGIAVLVAVAISVYRSGPGSEQSSGDSTPTIGTAENGRLRDELKRLGIDPSSKLEYVHYLYFSSEADARAASAALASEFTVDVQPPGDGVNDWSVIAKQTVAIDARQLDALTARMNDIAQQAQGEYDGWEVAVGP